jgi:hypothetical protein
MKNAALAILFGLNAACSNQTATPSTIAKPPATVPATQGPARPPGALSVPTTTASGATPTSTTSGIVVLNQFDPPVPMQVGR